MADLVSGKRKKHLDSPLLTGPFIAELVNYMLRRRGNNGSDGEQSNIDPLDVAVSKLESMVFKSGRNLLKVEPGTLNR